MCAFFKSAAPTIVIAILAAGCSNDSSKPAAQPGNTPAITQSTKPDGDSVNVTPVAPSDIGKVQPKPLGRQDPGSAAPSNPDGTKDEPDKNEPADLVAKLKEMQNKPLRGNDQGSLVAHLNEMVQIAEKALEQTLEPADRDQVRETAIQAIGMLSQFQPKRRELLDKADSLAEKALADNPEGTQANNARFFRALTHLNIERDGSENDPEVNKRLFALAKEYADVAPEDPKSGQLLFMIAQNAMMDNQNDTATEIFRYLVKTSPDGQFGQMASAKLQLMEAIGKPPEIAGPTLDGSEISISDYKGKVVLVDFWATWCGPCIAELPNVRKVYEKYHDQGFEVLAISFDRTKGALEKFVADQKLPWPQIFFDEDGKRFWENPIGRKYGIDSIPATFLVDREGNLQQIGVRGEMLEPAVAALIGANGDANEKPAAEKTEPEKKEPAKTESDKTDSDKPANDRSDNQ